MAFYKLALAIVVIAALFSDGLAQQQEGGQGGQGGQAEPQQHLHQQQQHLQQLQQQHQQLGDQSPTQRKKQPQQQHQKQQTVQPRIQQQKQQEQQQQQQLKRQRNVQQKQFIPATFQNEQQPDLIDVAFEPKRQGNEPIHFLRYSAQPTQQQIQQTQEQFYSLTQQPMNSLFPRKIHQKINLVSPHRQQQYVQRQQPTKVFSVSPVRFQKIPVQQPIGYYGEPESKAPVYVYQKTPIKTISTPHVYTAPESKGQNLAGTEQIYSGQPTLINQAPILFHQQQQQQQQYQYQPEAKE